MKMLNDDFSGGGDEDDDGRHLGGAKDRNFPHKVWAVLLSSGAMIGML